MAETVRTPTIDDVPSGRGGRRCVHPMPPAARLGALVGGLLVAVAVAVGGANTAGAQQAPGGDQGVSDAQAKADQAAGAYLDALTKSQQVDAEIVQIEQNVATLEQRYTELRSDAQVRAVEAYKRSGTPIAVLLGDEAPGMDGARRTVLLDYLNARDDTTVGQYRKVRDGLQTRQHELKDAQVQQAAVVAQLKGEEDRLNAELISAQNKRRAAAGAPASSILALGNYVPSPGENPHHNDPFLVCTRGIESKGNYQAYNPSGPYYGAYQFDQSTWNATANHDGRGDLVGIDPRNASEYDQDEMAWTLYQWRGNGPWMGRC
ncbi:MAG TPA: transglycosylase family protein [Acidimicrobiia bacterium]|nr:transglycosylase family protein [Acidimicrobiia bacterium]